MQTRRKARKARGDGILLRYRDRDTAHGVTRDTAVKLAETLGVSETQVVHIALANLAEQTLPSYEADSGPLTDEQKAEIRRQQPPGRMKTRERLL